jgi:serine/threonine protein kinase
VQREYDCVRRIAQSKYADTIRTTKLLGFVVDAEDGHELGILEECIPGACSCCESLAEAERFHEVTSVVPIALRRAWISQLCETLSQLHEIGLASGGVSASSVIISKTGHVFIIDFAGIHGPNDCPQELWVSSTEMMKAFERLSSF